jgi:hypothetical protein
VGTRKGIFCVKFGKVGRKGRKGEGLNIRGELKGKQISRERIKRR